MQSIAGDFPEGEGRGPGVRFRVKISGYAHRTKYTAHPHIRGPAGDMATQLFSWSLSLPIFSYLGNALAIQGIHIVYEK